MSAQLRMAGATRSSLVLSLKGGGLHPSVFDTRLHVICNQIRHTSKEPDRSLTPTVTLGAATSHSCVKMMVVLDASINAAEQSLVFV